MNVEKKMDMQQSPAVYTSAYDLSVRIPESKVIITITADGKKMRGDKELKDLTRDELLTLVDDLIDLIRRR